MLAFFAGFYAILGSTESLWLDELHTSWTVSGPLSEIGYRARAGNQSPVYFWVLWCANIGLGETLGHEIALRGLSILAWATSIWLVARYVLRHSNTNAAAHWIALGSVMAWILLDRIQLFYATEARVYALVQLLSLSNWLIACTLVSRVSIASSEGHRKRRTGTLSLLGCWFGISLVLIYLHLTAGLAVFVQWLVLVAMLWFQTGSKSANATPSDSSADEGKFQVVSAGRMSVLGWYLVLAGAIAIASIPAFFASQSVWEHRYQWESFAGDASLGNAVSLFPVLVFFVPIALGRLADGFFADRRVHSKLPTATCQLVWFAAAFGPWVIAWLVTAAGIAPVFHRRFVIVSGIPLVLFALTQWQQIRVPLIRLFVSVGVIACLVVYQGSLNVWLSGDLVGWQRAEGWREVTHWMDSRIAPEDQVWVASGLIEGKLVSPPLTEMQAEYLSFPLRGSYRVRDSQGVDVEPNALVGDWRKWRRQWTAASDDGSPRRVLWIVRRGGAEQLQTTLERVFRQSGVRYEFAESPRGFGRVSLAVIRVAKNEL